TPLPAPAMPAASSAVAGMASLHQLLDTARQLLAQHLPGGAGDAAPGALAGADMLAGLAALAGQRLPAAGTDPGAMGAMAAMGAAAQRTAPAPPARAVPSEAVMDVLARLQPQGAAAGTRRSFGDIQK